MFLIIGLGNPGKKYKLTRHNAGFLLLDKIRNAHHFPDFKLNKDFKAEISEGNIDGKKAMLVKPQTLMNASGEAVQKIMNFYKLAPEDIIVIHDDLDIPLGSYKIATDSRSAGHNGVQNIIDILGTQKFQRLRIGIGKPPAKKTDCPLTGHDYVLGKFTEEESAAIEKITPGVLEEIKKLSR